MTPQHPAAPEPPCAGCGSSGPDCITTVKGCCSACTATGGCTHGEPIPAAPEGETDATPEPSEVAETTAGEREVEALLAAHDGWTDEVDAERTTDSQVVWAFRCRCGVVLPRGSANEAHRAHVATALAAHVSAAETKARADERERIAEAIASLPLLDVTGHALHDRVTGEQMRYSAASIARGDARGDAR